MTYFDAAMVPLKPREEEAREQALGLLWELRERGTADESSARREVSARVGAGVFEALREKGLVAVKDGRVGFLPAGEALARELTRRHRLAERLLADVLDIRGSALESNACQWEHILSPEVALSICALLGHPRQCPHGQTIPSGPCCAGGETGLAPLLCRLPRLAPGQTARVAYLALPEPGLLHRLLALGLAPGAKVKLSQASPACVVQVGEAVLALEPELAEAIVVRRTPGER